MFAWKKYQDRGAEGQKIVHRRVLGITPPEPTLHFKMIVEDTILIFKSGTIFARKTTDF